MRAWWTGFPRDALLFLLNKLLEERVEKIEASYASFRSEFWARMGRLNRKVERMGKEQHAALEAVDVTLGMAGGMLEERVAALEKAVHGGGDCQDSRSLESRARETETLLGVFGQRMDRFSGLMGGLNRKVQNVRGRQQDAFEATHAAEKTLEARVIVLEEGMRHVTIFSEEEVSGREAERALGKRITVLEKICQGMREELDDIAKAGLRDERAADGEYDAQEELAYLVSLVEGLGRRFERLDDSFDNVRSRLDRLRRQTEAAHACVPELPPHQHPRRFNRRS